MNKHTKNYTYHHKKLNTHNKHANQHANTTTHKQTNRKTNNNIIANLLTRTNKQTHKQTNKHEKHDPINFQFSWDKYTSHITTTESKTRKHPREF